jgi:ketosteroid isomerase-like protein
MRGRDTPELAAEGIARVRRAYEQANEGDLSGLVELFGPDTVWYGFERRRFWLWRSAPS